MKNVVSSVAAVSDCFCCSEVNLHEESESVYPSCSLISAQLVTNVTKTWQWSVMLINLSGATFPQNRLSALLPSGQLLAAGALWDKNTLVPLFSPSLLKYCSTAVSASANSNTLLFYVR